MSLPVVVLLKLIWLSIAGWTFSIVIKVDALRTSNTVKPFISHSAFTIFSKFDSELVKFRLLIMIALSKVMNINL